MSTSSDEFPGSFDDGLLETPQVLTQASPDSIAVKVSAQYGIIKTRFHHLLGYADRLSEDDASTLDDLFLRMRLWQTTIAGSAGSIDDFERCFPPEADTVRMQMDNVLSALEDMRICVEHEELTTEEPDRPVKLLKASIQDLMALSESIQTLVGLRNGSGPEVRVKRAFETRRDASLLRPVGSSSSRLPLTPKIGNSLDPEILPEMTSPREGHAPFTKPAPFSAAPHAAEDEDSDGSWGSLVPLDPRYGSEPIILKRGAKELSTSSHATKSKLGAGYLATAMAADYAKSKERTSGYLIGRHPECDIVIKDTIVSNRHCLLFAEETAAGTTAIVEDLSTNGTYVNEAIVGRNKYRELQDNDEISVHGKARYVFRYPQSRQNTAFLTRYSILEKLGKGHFAEVYACIERSTGKRYAVKVFTNLGGVGGSSKLIQESIQQESSILMSASHPNILSIKDIFNERDKVYLVLELAPSGELFNYIIMKQKLTESETRSLFQQLFEGIKYLHERNIVHRDIKPENIFLMDDKEHPRAKLADFGLSKIIGEESFTTTLCGTPSYVAPEVLAESKNRKYTKAVDIWSLGVVLYICLCGFPPFSDELYSRDFPYTLSQQIKAGRFDYPSPYWDSVGDPALDLIDSMLAVDPERRFTVDQCMNHPWVTQVVADVNDSTEGLAKGIGGLEIQRRRLHRERTLLATIQYATPQSVAPTSKATWEEPHSPSAGDKRLFDNDDDDDNDDDAVFFAQDTSQARHRRKGKGPRS